MIKLTSFHNTKINVYINPEHIIMMLWMVTTECTKVVLTDNSILEFVETPEEILTLIAQSNTGGSTTTTEMDHE